MKSKTQFVCTNCGYANAKWLGRCPSCQMWNTLEESEIEEAAPPSVSRKSARTSSSVSVQASSLGGESSAQRLDSIGEPAYIRTPTGIGELDRVLGGGLVTGSVVLLSGEPGIGKSTLLMQLSGRICGDERRILYVSGEESKGQLKLRAKRLGVAGSGLFLLTDPDVDVILREIGAVKPSVVIVDSVQTLNDERLNSSSGSVTQVRETVSRLIARAKSDDIAMLLVGHINKEGGIAGPKVLEHMVDAVLYFEGERRFSHRIVRAIKNRFGSTNEIGVFDMTESGLREIPNPSEMMLCDRPEGVSGTCAVVLMEGSRPIITEIQALTSETAFSAPRRAANGIDYNRCCLLLAVLEKRLGLRFSGQDVYINVTGGLEIDEPSCDLSTALALVSSIRDLPIPPDVIAAGEIGLAGECRASPDIAQRVSEAQRLGFKRFVLPVRSAEQITKKPEIQLIPVKSVYEALKIFGKG